jgi:hypothetical protein
MMERELCVRLMTSGNSAYWQVFDFYMWLCLALEQRNIYVIPEWLTFFVEHGTNISSASQDSYIRQHNELIHIYYHLFKSMEAATFQQIFHGHFKNPLAATKEELLCEKFFLLMNHSTPAGKLAAMLFYYDTYRNPEFPRCLREKYDYSAVDFMKFEKTVACVRV